jgi:hypothetical protein
MVVSDPLLRCGSIWKMPPCAQSLAWIFIETPVPVRPSSTESPPIVTEIELFSTMFWGTLLANTGVN